MITTIDKKHVTAEWARNQAMGVLGEKVRKELLDVLGKIEDAVKGNNLSITKTGGLEELTRTELSKRGFVIKWVEGDFRDQRDCGYYTISW